MKISTNVVFDKSEEWVTAEEASLCQGFFISDCYKGALYYSPGESSQLILVKESDTRSVLQVCVDNTDWGSKRFKRVFPKLPVTITIGE